MYRFIMILMTVVLGLTLAEPAKAWVGQLPLPMLKAPSIPMPESPRLPVKAKISAASTIDAQLRAAYLIARSV